MVYVPWYCYVVDRVLVMQVNLGTRSWVLVPLGELSAGVADSTAQGRRV
jgi:hypothetical protein